eukprot:TRINITY_DN16295_c0_g1_i1.p1 TRINITY_DN16295_c0_g1~~TRINITY_DN16295_c0_g1_i1.p1  ORF type:complete len:671 (+),score=156.25 TRINITY_DN16295_c0_g1_i1:68-2080(+)
MGACCARPDEDSPSIRAATRNNDGASEARRDVVIGSAQQPASPRQDPGRAAPSDQASDQGSSPRPREEAGSPVPPMVPSQSGIDSPPLQPKSPLSSPVPEPRPVQSSFDEPQSLFGQNGEMGPGGGGLRRISGASTCTPLSRSTEDLCRVGSWGAQLDEGGLRGTLLRTVSGELLEGSGLSAVGREPCRRSTSQHFSPPRPPPAVVDAVAAATVATAVTAGAVAAVAAESVVAAALAAVAAALAATVGPALAEPQPGTPASPTPPAPDVSSAELGVLLGRGRFASVYRAELMLSGELQDAAVKVVDASSLSQAALAKLRREAAVLCSIRDRHLVSHYACAVSGRGRGRELRLAMQLAHGSIADCISRVRARVAHLPGPPRPRLPSATIRLWTLHVFRGLQHLHGRSIVHGDLKGANVLLTAEGVGVLGDFGVSRALEAALSGGHSVGSPQWMAPEVVSGAETDAPAYTSASDVWSAGCTVLEMLGRQPWVPPGSGWDNPWSLLFAIGRSRGPPTGLPSEQEGSEAAAGLRHLLLHCFSSDTASRPSAVEATEHPALAEAEADPATVQPPEAVVGAAAAMLLPAAKQDDVVDVSSCSSEADAAGCTAPAPAHGDPEQLRRPPERRILPPPERCGLEASRETGFPMRSLPSPHNRRLSGSDGIGKLEMLLGR